MAKQWTREELTNLTKQQFESLSQEEQFEVKKQGRAFMVADLDKASL